MVSAATKAAYALIVTAVLVACSTSGSAPTNSSATTVGSSLPAPEVLAAIPNAAAVEARIGSFDVLEVTVYRVDDLNRTVQVDARGQITLPLIGTVQAGGKTVSELEEEIAGLLRAKYLQSPQVSVFVKEAVSQRVTVEGAVASPGMVELVGPTTLLQTIALSGGLSEAADPRGIVVFRTVHRQRMAAKFDLVAIRSGKAEDPVLSGGDIVVVDKSGFRALFNGLRNSIPVFGLFTALAA